MPCGPAEPTGFGPGVGAVPRCAVGCGRGAIFTWETEPGVTSGTGEAIATTGAAVTATALGSGTGVAGGAVGAAVGFGRGVGAAVGGTRIDAATYAAVGTLVGTVTGSGAGETAITACVGTGFGASELTGAGVGFGGAVGANFASSCRTRGCCGAERGCATGRVF
jgi:hypothetical protein